MPYVRERFVLHYGFQFYLSCCFQMVVSIIEHYCICFVLLQLHTQHFYVQTIMMHWYQEPIDPAVDGSIVSKSCVSSSTCCDNLQRAHFRRTFPSFHSAVQICSNHVCTDSWFRMIFHVLKLGLFHGFKYATLLSFQVSNPPISWVFMITPYVLHRLRQLPRESREAWKMSTCGNCSIAFAGYSSRFCVVWI